MNSIKGKWALVTGSSRGIGQQIAIGLAQLQCNVIVHGRTEKNVEKTLRLLEPFNIKTHAVIGDLGTSEGIDAVISGIDRGYAPADILYNNAAIQGPWQATFASGIDVWTRVFQINVFSVVAL